MFRPDLTPAQHVARREAIQQLARGADLGRGSMAIDDHIIRPLSLQFLKGHRLDGPAFGHTVDKARRIISAFGPAIMDEAVRRPTRAKPKGEEHEILSLSRAPGDPALRQSGYEILGICFSLSRRRLGYSFDGTAVYLTKHLLERTIERGHASWTGKFAEVEDAVLGSLGLACVWRRAAEAGLIKDPRIALPCGSGLIYGIMVGQNEPRFSARISISGSRIDRLADVPNNVLTHPRIAATGATDIVLRTAVDEDIMTLEQCDLRDALYRFSEVHEPVLTEIMRSLLWRRSALTPPAPYEDLAGRMDVLGRDLVSLLSAPDARHALAGRRGDGPTIDYAPSFPMR